MKQNGFRLFVGLLMVLGIVACTEIEPSNSTEPNGDSSAPKQSETVAVEQAAENQVDQTIVTSMKVQTGDFGAFIQDSKQHLQLTALSIEENLTCSDWEKLGQFENLTYLSVQETDCQLPPVSKGKWTKMTNIHVVLPPNQKTIPNSIFELKTLTTLEIEGIDLQNIPNEIEKLANLEEIDFGISPIAALPKALGSLPNLQTIYLSEASNTQKLIQGFNKDFPHISIEIH